ncbi:hypothetical protein LH464_17465 [Neorhizobium sp. T786]|uniref:hypothetical protein n=1 Tax=Pseudorhizobium xiangyangii TaxID=2883104 RepID=UPI001CFF6292|nr:hypothetical protein [Neorhizobium xiangyangii]MCB5204258.1 hypothetical protein [Neorhizobium xiangyangii]
MNDEAEIKVLDGHLSAAEAVLMLLIRQLGDSGVLDRRKLAETVTENAEREFRRIKTNPQPDDDDRVAVSARQMKVLARRILALPEPPEFQPSVVASRSDDP